MRKKILISVLSIFAFGAVALSSALIDNSTNNPLSVIAETVNSNVLIADKYVLGDTVELPNDATLEYEGQSYKATVTLRDPDGRGYNSDKVVLTGKKLEQKKHYHHTGFVGGMKEEGYDKLLAEKSDYVVTLAVKGMLPKNTLGRAMAKKLKVYKDANHGHEAQKPELIVLKGVRE